MMNGWRKLPGALPAGWKSKICCGVGTAEAMTVDAPARSTAAVSEFGARGEPRGRTVLTSGRATGSAVASAAEAGENPTRPTASTPRCVSAQPPSSADNNAMGKACVLICIMAARLWRAGSPWRGGGPRGRDGRPRSETEPGRQGLQPKHPQPRAGRAEHGSELSQVARDLAGVPSFFVQKSLAQPSLICNR